MTFFDATKILLALGALALGGCADDSQQLNSSSSALTGEAATSECMAACAERGLSEDECSAACANAGASSANERGDGASMCMDNCLEATGGDGAACRERCARDTERQDGGNDEHDACYEGCLEAGGNAEQCWQRCTRDEEGEGERREGEDFDWEACLGECVDSGGDEEGCRARCAEAAEGGERDEGEQDLDDMADFEACNEACLEAGGDPLECREQCSEPELR